MSGNRKPCLFNIIWLAVSSMLKFKTPIMHRVHFSTWMTSVLLSMNWSEIIPQGIWLIQNRKLTKNMINCIFQLNRKANAAHLKWNFVFIRSIRHKSAVTNCTNATCCRMFKDSVCDLSWYNLHTLFLSVRKFKKKTKQKKKNKKKTPCLMIICNLHVKFRIKETEKLECVGMQGVKNWVLSDVAS